MMLPPPVAILAGFARLLRGAGIPVATDQVTRFLDAVRLLGPRGMEDIRAAALATLGVPPERLGEFDTLFHAYFWGDTAAIPSGDDEEEEEVKDDVPTREEFAQETRPDTGGALTSGAERLSVRDFARREDALAWFRRDLSEALPVRRTMRRVAAQSGLPDLRCSRSQLVRADGDMPSPLRRRRQVVQRRLILLIDISGSMRDHTPDHLDLAHAAVQGARETEVFTLGTRLTRISPSLRMSDRNRALARVSGLVEDWDGGTRLGPTLLSFLGIPRFANLARGAAVLILSDGLERGDPAEMALACRRLAARAHRLSLCTPLAADPRFRPETAALSAILPVLDDLVDGSSVPALTRFILSLGQPAPPARDLWRKAA